jgi:hypothetical protein
MQTQNLILLRSYLNTTTFADYFPEIPNMDLHGKLNSLLKEPRGDA